MTNVEIQSSLLSELQNSSNLKSIYQRFTSYLKPFKNYQCQSPDFGFLYDLSRDYGAFIHNALSIIPKTIPKFKLYPNELFDTYSLLLDCLDVLSPLHNSKHLIPGYQLKMINFLIDWRIYDEAKSLLTSLFKFTDGQKDRGQQIVPDYFVNENGQVDVNMSISICDAVLLHIRCVVESKSEKDEDYRNIISNVGKMQPWLRVINDAEKTNKQNWLVMYLFKCVSFLQMDNNNHMQVIADFCAMTILEYNKVDINNNETIEFEHMILKSFFSKSNYEFLFNVMDAMAPHKSKDEKTHTKAPDVVTSLQLCLEQLRAFVGINKTLYKRIEIYIISIIDLENIFNKQDNSFRDSRSLIAKAKKSLEEKEEFDKCIEYLNKAVTTLDKLCTNVKDEECAPVYHVLAHALCLQALCTYEADPSSKHFVQDIGKALKLWMKKEHVQFVEQNDLVSEYTFYVLYHICDSLLLKASMEDHYSDIYNMMLITFCNTKKNYLEKRLTMLWESKSIGHALCNSTFSNLINRTEITKSTDQVKQEVHGLITNVPMSTKSSFLAAHLYYDLGQRMVAKQSMTKAFFYAREARRLRSKLLNMNFKYSIDEVVPECNLINIQMHPSVATKAWSCSFEDFILTPYNILRCYLESLFQEGTILEILGNRKRAYDCLLWGKKIATLRHLPIFEARFSITLGKIYQKQQSFDDAQNELNIVKNTYRECSCVKCKFVLEVKYNQELGDLNTSLFNTTTTKLSHCKVKVAHYYNTAIEKLRQGWIDCAQNEAGNNLLKRKSPYSPIGKGLQESKVRCTDACGCKFTDGGKCWHCVPIRLIKSDVERKWELARRCHLLGVLIRKGKWLVVNGTPQEAHEVLLESICLLVSMNTRQPSPPCSVSFSFLFEFFTIKDVHGTELAELLYIISFFSLKSSYNKGKRNQSSDKFIPTPTLVSGLMLAFILSSDVPELFRKISLLLAIIYTLSPDYKDFSVPASINGLSESHWASFFHQATLGTHLSYELDSRLQKIKNDNIMDVKVSSQSSSSSIGLRRLVPDMVMDLKNFVMEFFQGLPRVMILGISCFRDGYGSLPREILPYSATTHAWLMISRFNLKGVPMVVILPISSVFQVNDVGKRLKFKCSGPSLNWKCPWDNTIVDIVAPNFKKILEERFFCTNFNKADTDYYWKFIFKRMGEIDDWIGTLLSFMERQWLGKWKNILLGESLEDSLNKCYICDGESQNSFKEQRLRKALSFNRGKVQKREPVILVLDSEIQMLPWESMPVLKYEEVYRMPSVANILYYV